MTSLTGYLAHGVEESWCQWCQIFPTLYHTGFHATLHQRNKRQHRRARSRLVGSCYGSASVFADFPRLANLYLSGKLKIDELITHRYGIDEVNEAFRALAAGELARGIIVF